MTISEEEIAQIKASRAANLKANSETRKPTVPTIPVKSNAPLAEIATRAMKGSYNVSDIRFMAMALLQMNDTLGELKERVRRLEAGE